MSKLTGRYLYSEETLLKAGSYLKSLAAGTSRPGGRLARLFSKANIFDFSTMDAKQLIVWIMNTRLPTISAVSEPSLDGLDWNIQENAILGDIVFSTTGTKAFNDGAHARKSHQDHAQPLDINFLFVSSALLRNDQENPTSDMNEVLFNNTLNEEAFYKLYERRLLPGLLVQNEQARKENKQLVINIPGLGFGQFAGDYSAQVRAAFPRVLKRLFETHGAKLDKVYTINYDPYLKMVKDDFTTSYIPNTQIRLMARPFQGLPEGASGSVASQLEFPKDGADYTDCRLVKIVVWDPFSFPGNAIWANHAELGNGRITDNGISVGSSNVISALIAMGQFGKNLSSKKIEYNPEHGIVYAINPNDNQILGYQQLAKRYPSHVTADMINAIAFNPINDVQHLFKGLRDSPEENPNEFENKKQGFQERFVMSLNVLSSKLQTYPSEGKQLYDTLFQHQKTFFDNLTSKTTEEELNAAITIFRERCHENISQADKIMSHGWLYQTVEIAIKAVVGLFVGIGMILVSVAGQGAANAAHRQQFVKTFFTLNQTHESQALYAFKQNGLR